MHDSWSYGLAIVVVVLLIIAAVLIAYEDNQHDNRERVKRREKQETPVFQLPLDFGAL